MKMIKWGVLGTAYIFERDTAEGMRQAENCELYAIAGRSMEKAQAFKEKYGFQKAYGSYDELLADPEVEAVYVPMPNTLHKEWTIKALNAKKHVLCEKPMAPNAAEAAEMFAAAKANGVVLMEAFAYQHSPFVAAVREEIDKGTIGDVRYMEAALITSDYDLSNIRMRRETLGGSVYDLGCYCVSQAIWLLGEPDDVRAVGDFSEAGVDRLATGLLCYPGGRRAAFTCGMLLATEQDRRLDRLQIHGTEGVLRCDAQFNQAGRLCYRIEKQDCAVTRYVDVPQNYNLEVAQLGRCIAEGEQPHVSAEFTLATARTLDKVLSAIGY